MQNLTPKQVAILTAMKKIGGPSGVQKIMTESNGMESKTQVKNILDELVELNVVVYQSNSQYRATPEALKSIIAAPTPATAITVKPEAYQAKIKSLQAEIDTLKANIKEAAKHAGNQADHLANLKSALGITGSSQLETISRAAEMRAALKREQQDSAQWLRHIACIREAAGDKGKLPLSEFIQYIKTLHHDGKNLDYLKGELEGIAEQVNYQPHEHDCISMAVACALEKQRTASTVATITPHPTEQKRNITTAESIRHLSDLISGIFDDQTRIAIYPNGIVSEIIVNDNRFEIPASNSDETDQFIEALCWVSGQYIEDDAA